MARGAESSSSSAKRAKVDEEDPLVRRRNELVLLDANARAEGEKRGERLVREAEEEADRLMEEAQRLMREAEEEADRLKREAEEEAQRLKREAKDIFAQDLRSVCADLEAANRKLLGKLPPELWSKIVDENIQQNDLLALAMTCRFFRDTTKDLGKKLETNVNTDCLLQVRNSGKEMPHSMGWFQWVCDTFEIQPGYKWDEKRVEGAVYKGDLVNYAAFQGSVEILRWLMEEKGWELNCDTGKWAGQGGSVEILEYLRVRGYHFFQGICAGAAKEGRLEALKFLRGLAHPCPWSAWTCAEAARGGHLEVLKWARAQEPPCPWNWETCADAAHGGHLDVLKWARSQDPPCPWSWATCAEAAYGGHLEVLAWARDQDPPCPWSRCKCRRRASKYGHQHVVDWIDQQEDESDVSSDLSYISDEY
ncbi:hypothetical protein HKI87_05g34550 [Chloropicon roscoffensis]|uniref:F-box domain-containing protein n=1 Tax=Chloropicon roscoffensis TaxID=1461544 RepID=A0AAX4P6T5_9CHLO